MLPAPQPSRNRDARTPARGAHESHGARQFCNTAGRCMIVGCVAGYASTKGAPRAARPDLRSPLSGCYDQPWDQTGRGRERSQADHRSRAAPAPDRGVDRRAAGAGGVFLLLVGRLRHRCLPEPVARRRSQGHARVPGARANAGASSACSRRGGGERASPCGRDHPCCCGCPGTWGCSCCRGRSRGGAARRLRSGGRSLSVGVPRRYFHRLDEARAALIAAQRALARPIGRLSHGKKEEPTRRETAGSAWLTSVIFPDHFVYIGLAGAGASGPQSLYVSRV